MFHKKANKLESNKFEENCCQDNNVNDSVDSPTMSWISNLLLNQKTQQEIIKDVVDGILDLNQVEQILPMNITQELRLTMPDHAKNLINGCLKLSDSQSKGLLIAKLIRECSTEMLKLLPVRTSTLRKITRFYPGRRGKQGENKSNVAGTNVSTSSKKLSTNGPSDVNDVKSNKETNDLSAKKKKNTTRQDKVEVNTKKDERELNTKKDERELNTKTDEKEVITKKDEKDMNAKKQEMNNKKVPRNVMKSPKPFNEKRSMEETSSTMLQNRNNHEKLEESSLKSQGDQQEASTSNKTANSKKASNVKKASKKVGQDLKPRVRNQRKSNVKKCVPLLTNIDHDYTEEREKSRGEDIEMKNNENEASERVTESRDCNLQKSRLQQIGSSASFLKDGEEDTCGSKEDKKRNVPEYNFNIPFESSTPKKLKKLNCDTKMIRIKEEPQSECSFDEFNYPIEKEKLFNGCNDFCQKEESYSTNKLPTKNVEKTMNAGGKTSKAKDVKSEKVSEPSKEMVNPEKYYVDTKKKTKARRSNNGEEKKDTKVQQRRLDRKEQEIRKKMRRREKKMQKAMVTFSDEVIKLVKDMGYLESSTESEESSSSCCCSEKSSNESSYSSSSEESCSCSNCDASTSYEYSEYTLCSCSNCGSSCSDSLSTSRDSNETNEE